MSVLQKIYGAIKAALLSVPGGTAVILPVIVALASRYGFHVSVTELTVIMSAVSAVVGFLVHAGVKVAKAKAVAAKQ